MPRGRHRGLSVALHRRRALLLLAAQSRRAVRAATAWIEPADLITQHIRQLAAEGALPIWGKRPGSWALWELAPSGFWRHYQVDYQSFLKADPKLLHALPCNGVGHAAAIRELMTSRAAVEEFCESVAL
jgi:hypothetical protein